MATSKARRISRGLTFDMSEGWHVRSKGAMLPTVSGERDRSMRRRTPPSPISHWHHAWFAVARMLPGTSFGLSQAHALPLARVPDVWRAAHVGLWCRPSSGLPAFAMLNGETRRNPALDARLEVHRARKARLVEYVRPLRAERCSVAAVDDDGFAAGMFQ